MIELKYAPHTLIVDQTVLCQQECYFCWRSDREQVRAATAAAEHQVMPLEIYREIVDACGHVSSIRNLGLCGPMGEPALVPDLSARGLYARRSRNFPGWVCINTNGYALDRHDPAELLRGFTRVQVSLDAVDEETYGRVHGKPAQFERVVRNVEALARVPAKLRNGGRLLLRFTENERNAGQWPAFRKRWAGKADGFIHRRVHTFVDVVHRREELGERGARQCNQPHGSVNFNYRGELTTCCINYKMSPTFGTLREGGIKALWEGRDFEAWRGSRLSGLCRGCSGLGKESQGL